MWPKAQPCTPACSSSRPTTKQLPNTLTTNSLPRTARVYSPPWTEAPQPSQCATRFTALSAGRHSEPAIATKASARPSVFCSACMCAFCTASGPLLRTPILLHHRCDIPSPPSAHSKAKQSTTLQSRAFTRVSAARLNSGYRWHPASCPSSSHVATVGSVSHPITTRLAPFQVATYTCTHVQPYIAASVPPVAQLSPLCIFLAVLGAAKDPYARRPRALTTKQPRKML